MAGVAPKVLKLDPKPIFREQLFSAALARMGKRHQSLPSLSLDYTGTGWARKGVGHVAVW